MSGYKDDIVSILKHANLLHSKSVGYIKGVGSNGEAGNLLDHLTNLGLSVTGIHENILWDDIIIPQSMVSTRAILQALSGINSGGIVILEVTEKQSKYQSKYLRLGADKSATKVQYGDRYYLVIHTGDDYGN